MAVLFEKVTVPGFVKDDGSVPFVQTQAGIAPVADADLATKLYVDAAAGGARVVFTATTVFAYRHALGVNVVAQVVNSTGEQIEVCVSHPDLDTVALTFSGTITNGVLLLNANRN